MITQQLTLLTSLILALNAQAKPDCKYVQVIYAKMGGFKRKQEACCGIAGTECSNGDVVKINWSHKGLHGVIPRVISQLRNLESLDLSNNQLNGEIPDGMKKLRKLHTLNIDVEEFCGNIPSALLKFTGERKTLGSCDGGVGGGYYEPPKEIYEPEPPQETYDPEPPKEIYEPEPPQETYDPEPPQETYDPEPPQETDDPEPHKEIYTEPSLGVSKVEQTSEPPKETVDLESDKEIYAVSSEGKKVEQNQYPELVQEKYDDNANDRDQDNSVTDQLPIAQNDSTTGNVPSSKTYGYALGASTPELNEGQVLGRVNLISILGTKFSLMQ